MTIEVRQMLIKSTVSGSATPSGEDRGPPPPGPWLEQLREDLMAECKALVEDRLQRARER
jgi:hypothetical protein